LPWGNIGGRGGTVVDVDDEHTVVDVNDEQSKMEYEW